MVAVVNEEFPMGKKDSQVSKNKMCIKLKWLPFFMQLINLMTCHWQDVTVRKVQGVLNFCFSEKTLLNE